MHRDKAGFDLGVKDYSHSQSYSMTLPHITTDIENHNLKKEEKQRRKKKAKASKESRAMLGNNWKTPGEMRG